MKKMTPEECFDFIQQGTRTGKLATVRADGRPHCVPVWFVVDGDDIVFNTWHTSVKAKNIAHDPRVTISVDMQEPPYAFVMAEGEASVSDDPAEKLRIATAIGARYMGADRADEFGQRNGVEGELIVRVKVTKIIGRDDMAGY